MASTRPLGQTRAQQSQSKTLPTVLKVTHEQLVHQKQSLEVVQTLLLASISTLAYLRELFPDHSFEDRIYSSPSTRDTHHSYQDFVDGTKLPTTAANNALPPSDPRKHSPKPMKTLVRGRYPAVDKLLDWLELGIFDALKKNYLAAIQLTIFEDKVTPSNIFEAYTFSFKYSGGEKSDSRRLAGLEFQGSTGKPITVRDVKYGLQSMVRRLVELDTFLPELPDSRFLTIHLFYTKDCPMQYEPEGFQKCEDRSILFPESPDLIKQTTSCGHMDTGLHRVSLKVRSLHWIGADGNDPETSGQIPNNLRYGKELSRTEDIDMSDAEPSGTHSMSTPPSKPELTPGHNPLQTEDIGYQGLRSHHKQSAEKSSRISNSAEDARRRQDEDTNEMLRRMVPLEPSTQDSNLVPTQPLSQNTESLCQPQPHQQSPPKDKSKIRLSQAKIDELEVRREDFGLSRGSKRSGQVPQEIIHCECGWNHEEGDMVLCEYCDTHQHSHCYGFGEPIDRRLFASHICYTCLLAEKEMPLLHEMISLIVFRRALRVIYENGYPRTSTDFADLLHCDSKTAHEVTRRLRAEGYLTSTPGSHSKGFSQKNLPKFMAVKSETQRERMEHTYFNPLARIAHHYSLPDVRSPGIDSPTDLRDLLAVTATKEETVNSAVPEVRAIISGANVAPSSKLEYAKGVWPTMLADETQDLNTEEAALSHGVSFGALPPAPLQRKRSHDDHNGVRKVKRMKSSNPVQPINVGDTE